MHFNWGVTVKTYQFCCGLSQSGVKPDLPLRDGSALKCSQCCVTLWHVYLSMGIIRAPAIAALPSSTAPPKENIFLVLKQLPTTMTKYPAGHLGIIRFLPLSFTRSNAWKASGGLCLTHTAFGGIAINGWVHVLAFLLISYHKIS